MPEMPQADIDALAEFRAIARKHGGTPDKLADKLDTVFGENADYRKEIGNLKKLVPAEGSVVLTGDQVPKWEKVKDADVDALIAKAEKADTLETKLADRDRSDLIAFGFKQEGWSDKAIPVASRLLDGATLEKRPVKVRDDKGAETEREFLFVTREGQQAVRLAELHEKDSEFGALAVEAKPTTATQPSRTWPAQPQGDPPKPAGPDDHRKAVAAQVDYSV